MRFETYIFVGLTQFFDGMVKLFKIAANTGPNAESDKSSGATEASH